MTEKNKIIERVIAEMSDVSDVGRASDTLGFSVLAGRWTPPDERSLRNWNLYPDEDHNISVFWGIDQSLGVSFKQMSVQIAFVVDQVDQAKLFKLLDFFHFGFDGEEDIVTGLKFTSNLDEDVIFRRQKIKSFFEKFNISDIEVAGRNGAKRI